MLDRFCCANAEMAHALRHWRYALNQTVLQWLADDGQLTPAKIVERENLRQKKRQKAANKVVDEMEATGVMKVLYKQFKENLEAARDSKVLCFIRCLFCFWLTDCSRSIFRIAVSNRHHKLVPYSIPGSCSLLKHHWVH